MAPVAADNAFIDNSGTATLAVGESGSAANIYVGSSGSGNLLVNGGLVTNTTDRIGAESSGRGSATLTSGTWAIARNPARSLRTASMVMIPDPAFRHLVRITSYALESVFSLTKRLRERKVAGLSNNRTARKEASGEANQGRCKRRFSSATQSEAGR